MSKRIRYYSRLALRLCTVFVMIFSILFLDLESVRADVVNVSRNYSAGTFTFETLTSLSDNLVPVSLVGFESSIHERFRDSDGNYLSMKVGNSYKINIQLNVTEDIECDIFNGSELLSFPSYVEHDVRFYLVFNGQRYELNRGGNLYSANFFVDGLGQNSFEIICVRDMYINVSGMLDTQWFYYLYGVSANVSYTITEYSGDDALDASDTVINNNISQGNQLQEEQNETTNNIFQSISDFFGSFFDNLIGIFVPEDGYFEDFFNRLNDFFSDKLGMLYAPIDMFLEFLDVFLTADSSDAGITFPEIKWEEHVIIPETKVSLGSYSEEFPQLQEGIYFATDVIMVGAVFMLLQNKLKEVMQN